MRKGQGCRDRPVVKFYLKSDRDGPNVGEAAGTDLTKARLQGQLGW